MLVPILRIAIPSVIAFVVALAVTPWCTSFMYRYRLWKRISRQDKATNPTITEEFQSIHNEKKEISTPRVGGVIIWIPVVVVTLLFAVLQYFFDENILLRELQFLYRSQTLIPFVIFVFGALYGLSEDLREVFSVAANDANGVKNVGLIAVITGVGIFVGSWFFTKLGLSSIMIPFAGEISLGYWYIPFAVLVILGTFSSRVIDGIDGLAGGVMAIIYASFATIAYFQDYFALSAFLLVITGGILAFLWFNIPPARFWMGETGMLPLTLTLAVSALILKQPLLLLVIGFPLVATSLSSFLQILSKKFRNGKKILRVAPLHHHFQALGWSNEKVVMRYWVLTIMFSVVGIIISFF
jgi:phospho-N-acetylmuramoyl-pentapeptide-transferase